jgi:hypothetical protein
MKENGYLMYLWICICFNFSLVLLFIINVWTRQNYCCHLDLVLVGFGKKEFQIFNISFVHLVVEAYKTLNIQNLVNITFQFGLFNIGCNCAHSDIGGLKLWYKLKLLRYIITQFICVSNFLNHIKWFHHINFFLMNPPTKVGGIIGWVAYLMLILGIQRFQYMSKKFTFHC